ncbi:hypothetical protein [Actinoplanes utahensis]|uniref:Uncharacterized protein n=1 Tax=Actinoplanes utahensis TaxID=1869 RepID=A0A0A6UBN2_ACTUT|nr:hypothetical protein [Actinoplanes utahensis]KHD73450.1 hypothetical protein MB27_35215 [Actinoplanes utahensis]GIF30238.1 hypothetical protein Aut01nite_32240 [Actinoplanes utahensis]
MPEELAPTAGQATAVIVWIVAAFAGSLGLLAGLAVLHRGRGPVTMVAVRRRASGLWFLTATGLGLLMLGGQVYFVRSSSGEQATLFEVHGTDLPVYWLAYSLGAALLTVLTLALLTFRDTLRLVIGIPTLLAGALLLGLLLTLYARIGQLDDEVTRRLLPAIAPTGELSVGNFAWEPGVGWGMAFAGTSVLTLVAVLVVAGRYELLVAVALAVIVCLATLPAPADLNSFWAVRDGVVEELEFSSFEVGGPALLWPLTMALLALLVAAIPVLPGWFRGLATLLAAAAPVWTTIASLVADEHYRLMLPEMLRDGGYTVSKIRVEVLAYLDMLAVLVAVPVAAVRAWRAARRGTPRPWTIPVPMRPAGQRTGAVSPWNR